MKGESEEEVGVVIPKGDLWSGKQVGETSTYCGICALKALNAEIIREGVIRIEITPTIKMSRKEAESKRLYSYDDRCMEFGCEKGADFVITTWYKTV